MTFGNIILESVLLSVITWKEDNPVSETVCSIKLKTTGSESRSFRLDSLFDF